MNGATIHRFARTNDVVSLEEAIEAGASINEKDKFGTTALQYSISESNHDITRCLLEHGADVMIQDDNGVTALHYAVEYNACAIAELLLNRNGNTVGVADKHGNQPLWTAVFNARGNYEIVDLLLRYGADAIHQNKVKASPLDLANRMGDDALVSRLEQSLESK